MLITLGLMNDNVVDSELCGLNLTVFSRWGQKERDVFCFSSLPDYKSVQNLQQTCKLKIALLLIWKWTVSSLKIKKEIYIFLI